MCPIPSLAGLVSVFPLAADAPLLLWVTALHSLLMGPLLAFQSIYPFRSSISLLEPSGSSRERVIAARYDVGGDGGLGAGRAGRDWQRGAGRVANWPDGRRLT